MTTLIATVGSNPLPVVVSVRALEPDRLRLIYTHDVEQVTNRICDHLKEKLPNCQIFQLEIKDHQKAKSIYATLGEITEDWPTTSLNYTGGTKLMAVHVYSFWKEKGGRPENASYLGSDGKLYFDNGNFIQENNLPGLSLDEQCLLHLGKIPHDRSNDHNKPNYLMLAQAIHKLVSKLGWGGYQELIKNPATVLHERLGVDKSIVDDSNDSFVKGGKWLEVWFAHQLEQIKIEDKPIFDKIEQNVSVDKNPNFEMDVVATRGYRVFLFSCTVKKKNDEVKWKFFEASNRTARIGGEHARAAMVCLNEEPQTVLRTVQAEHWPGYDTLRLFGQAHIKGEKAPCQVGEQARPVTLQEGIQEWVSQA